MKLDSLLNIGKYSSIQSSSRNNKASAGNVSGAKENFSASYLTNYPKNYYISFGARGMNLERFYNVNKDRMPFSVKEHIENLPDMNMQSPLEAHIDAYSLLADPDIQTTDDVKSLFSDEPLFKDLKSAFDTKAKRGFLYEARIMKDTLDEANEGILKTGEDLTLYLLKKIFLEIKPLDDINKDLDEDINPVFKREDKDYLNYSTLSALGIKLPSGEYLTSLRTTDEEYSKKIGGLISKALKEYYAAAGDDVASRKTTDRKPREISDETRAKQSEAQIKRWGGLSDSERVELISKMQAGNEFQRVVMTDAWNHCPEIRKDLSEFLIRHNMNMPEDLIYGTTAYNAYQSEIMTEFWKNRHSEDENKDYSKILGKEIRNARERTKLAEQNGNFQEYREGVYKKTAEIKKEIRELRKTIISKEQRMKEAKEELFSEYRAVYSFLPDSFIKFYLSDLQNLDVVSIETWVSMLKGEKIKPSDNEHLLKQLSEGKKDISSREKNAAELAMKTVLYNASKDSSIYNLAYKDLISCLSFAKQVKNYPCDIELKSREIGSKVIHFNKRPQFNDISNLYSYCMKDLDDEKARKLSSLIIGKLSACLYKNKSENDVMAFAASLYSIYRENFVAEVKKMGNVAVFANKDNMPAECQEFYARRIAQNAGVLEGIQEVARQFVSS